MIYFSISKFNYTVWHYLLIYAAISFGGMALPAVLGRELFVLLTLFIGLYYSVKTKTNVGNKYFMFLGILFVFLFFAFIGTGLSIGSILSTMSAFIFTYGIIACDPKNFLQRFLKILFVIAITSIFFFILTRSFGMEFFSPVFPYLLRQNAEHLSEGVYGYGGFIYRWTFIHSDRNCGPFGEPGQYQGVLSVALYLSLYKHYIFKSMKQQFLFIAVFTLCILTTLSTNGYIALTLIYFCYFIDPKTEIKIKKRVRIFFLIIIAILIFTGLGKETIEMVIYNKFMGNQGFTLDSNTTGARTRGMFEMLEYIRTQPSALMGMGYDRLQELNFDTVSGLPKLLLAVGLFPFTIIVLGIIYFAYKYTINIYEMVLVFMLFVSMGLGQPHIMNPCLFVMIFFSYILKIQMTRYRVKTLVQI